MKRQTNEAEAVRVEANGFELQVAESGVGTPRHLCLHGLVDSLEIWDRLADLWGDRGCLARMDQRGHGQSGSPPGPYRREDLANDVLRVLDHLGMDRAVLIGHSMGGIVSMTTALLHPDRVAGLVLIGTASQCNAKVAGWYERIAVAGEEGGSEGLARAIYGDRPREIRGDAKGIAHVTRTLKSLHDDPLTSRLSEISCPVLLLVGEKDPMGPKASEIIAAQVPRATLAVVPGCGHWVHVESPEVVRDTYDAWSKELA